MHAKVRRLLLVLVCLIVPPALVAQQGRHLVRGLGPNANNRNPVTIELNWETTTLSANVSPLYAAFTPQTFPTWRKI